jgi:D-3-phosphoglycerate dehydrogenase / 2-oxoglutarate reductase
MARPRILIAEKVSPDGLSLLQNSFLVDQKSLSPSELLEAIPLYDALVIRSETKVTAELLAAAKNLKVVARAGVGVDNVDVEAATKLGVIVVNSPSGNIVAAAEHTIALLLATARNIPAGAASLKDGQWIRSKLVGVEVSSKTLGIIGLGKVGLKVARMAIGLGMKAVAMDPYASPEIAATNSVTLVTDLKTLLPQSDFLTIHTPLVASTMDLISTAELKMMKPTARILNVARGGVYNEEALLEALESGTIAGAGLDVFTSEPPQPDSAASKLAQHPKVVATPHLGASTIEAQENVSIDVCAQVSTILSGGLPTSAVNAPLILPEEYRKLQPFVTLVEKMGSLYTQHYTSSRVGGRVFDLIYEGELASISSTRPLFAALIKGLTSSISDSGGRDVNIVNANLIAKQKGIIVNESHRRESTTPYASLVTLKTEGNPRTDGKIAGAPTVIKQQQLISGYVSGRTIHISRLDRFMTNFVPEGTLLICRNYDSPGKIGGVGSILGRKGVNINFMSVAGLSASKSKHSTVSSRVAGLRTSGSGYGEDSGHESGSEGGGANFKGENEALMILGVEGVVDKGVVKELSEAEGILDVSVVRL